MYHGEISQAAFIEGIQKNMAAYINVLQDVPGVEIDNRHGVIRAASGASVAFMNPTVTVGPIMDPEISVVETLEFFATRDLPFSWYDLRGGHSEQLHGYLLSSGANFYGDMPGMGLDLKQMKSSHRCPARLEIIAVDCDKDMQTWNDITSAVYDVPEHAGAAYSNTMSRLRMAPGVRYYIGVLSGFPAAALLMIADDGIAGIYSVATMPEARGKGIGSEITYRALLDAHNRDNCRMAVLEASKMGESVYRRLGFEEYCKVGLYVKEIAVQD